MKKYVLVNYEFNGNKGEVIINSAITDEEEIKDICVRDYLERNVKIIKKEKRGI